MINVSAHQGKVNPLSRHVAVDFETTGLYPQRGDRIVEIGAVALENGKCIAEFESLVNCGMRIPRRAQEVHGISNGMLIGQAPPEEALPDFLRFVSRGTLVAHNAKFDIEFLRYELARLGLGISNRYICTLQMSRKLYPHLPNHKLDTVCSHLLNQADLNMHRHRALDDARLTAKIWLRMINHG
jgi:DNA polymerase III epsilon subunit